MLHPPCSTLFPYTTLFRSLSRRADDARARVDGAALSRARRTAAPGQPRRRGRAAGVTRVNAGRRDRLRSEEHTSELQSLRHLVCRLLLEKKKKKEEKYITS